MKLIQIGFCLCLLACGCSRVLDESAETRSATNLISICKNDLAMLEEEIRSAEDDLIEYERLNQIHVVKARSKAEVERLEFVVGERERFEQELLLLEATHPIVTNTNSLSSVFGDDALRQRHGELMRMIRALEESENRWRSAYVLASTRESELTHLQDRIRRLNETYSQIAQRLHDLRMKNQLKSLQNQPSDPAR